jgi:hypothetical protein
MKIVAEKRRRERAQQKLARKEARRLARAQNEVKEDGSGTQPPLDQTAPAR